ncbi:hypothetical protein FB382_000210 [Nocardioides ginsengisegetis]|uniref:DUF559 domain-containing protein n=1 Tax=Nocardioides ginsengisegetis TaxID=661491 RepID=A0A7W3IWL5_9ACTN|nr:DUF559 domain-containing protein [Nocardioides ginsengisegetis]MBA8801919.1 hypothetical protein [Nocardioides ginsengisegetis]
MDPVCALERLGGVATTERLLRLTTPARLRAAWLAGVVVRLRRGIYALPGAERAIAAAARLGGIVSHLSAAQLHGWEVAFSPTCPWVSVPRNREVRERRGSLVFWADLDDERGPVTSPLRTVLDCGRRLAPGPALAVADSALRHRAVDRDELEVAAAGVRGKGAAKVRWIAAHADGRAFNPFESVHPDLVDVRRRLVLEADSWEFHTGREAHDRDCRRYDELVLSGWTVLRFTWRQVMYDPDWVLACLRSLA